MTAAPSCRFGDRCALETYEDVIECVGSHSDRPRTEIARRMAVLTGKSDGYIRSCLSRDDASHNLQASLLPALYEASGNIAPLRWLAKAAGFGVYRMPAEGNARQTLLALAEVFEATGSVAGDIRQADIDGVKTRAEAQRITGLISHAVQQLVELAAAVNLEVDPGMGRVARVG